ADARGERASGSFGRFGRRRRGRRGPDRRRRRGGWRWRPKVREARPQQLHGADREDLRATTAVRLVEEGVLNDDLLPRPIGHPDLGDRRPPLGWPDEDGEGRDRVPFAPRRLELPLRVVAREG